MGLDCANGCLSDKQAMWCSGNYWWYYDSSRAQHASQCCDTAFSNLVQHSITEAIKDWNNTTCYCRQTSYQQYAAWSGSCMATIKPHISQPMLGVVWWPVVHVYLCREHRLICSWVVSYNLTDKVSLHLCYKPESPAMSEEQNHMSSLFHAIQLATADACLI